MRVLIAPDKFKGGPTARSVADALSCGWRRVRPNDTIRVLPLADGGDGTLNALEQTVPGARRIAVPAVVGPTGQPVDAEYLLLPDGTAMVELARSSGIALLPALAALDAGTRGLGQVLRQACTGGARRVLIAVGGSASTDGGTGALRALGAELFDEAGRPLADGGGALERLHRLDLSGLIPPPPEGAFVWTDVTNPLLGGDGAAATFAPQKGATPAQVEQLERGLRRLSQLLGGNPVQPGAGAAGGTAYGLVFGWGARIVPGAAAVADRVGLSAALAETDLVITGEGCFDASSLAGKVVSEVLTRARASGVQAAMVVGQATQVAPKGVHLLTLSSVAGSTEASMREPLRFLEMAGAALAEPFRLPEE